MGKYNDGGVGIGSRKIQIFPQGAPDANGGSDWSKTQARGVYVAEGFPTSRPMYKQDRYDEGRAPNAGIGVPDVVRFSFSIQLATSATSHVVGGDAFTTVSDSTNGAESYVIEDVSEVESQGDIKKQTISVKKLYGTPAGQLPPQYPS